MADQLPDPIVPAEVDLRGYEYMPLDVVRLMRSSSWRKFRRQPELGYWSVNLWATSWHEVPAGSLPDDDDELADFARCDLRSWDKVKAKVLAGWVRCSDGRLYHPVVAEKALEAWDKMRLQRKRTQAARQALKQKLSQQPSTAPVTETDTASKGEEKKGTEQKGEDPPAAASSSSAREPDPPTAAAAAEDDDLAFPEALKGTQEASNARRTEDEAHRLWSTLASDIGFPDAGFLNSALRPMLAERLAEVGGLDGWKLALEKLRAAQYLREDDGRPKWWVNFKWLVDPGNFTGLMEGRYAEQHRRGNNADERSTAAALAGIAEAGAR